MKARPVPWRVDALAKAVAVACALAPLVGCGGWVAGAAAEVVWEHIFPPPPPLYDELEIIPGLDETLRWGAVGFWTGAGGTVAVWLACCCLRKRYANAACTLLVLAGLFVVWLQYDLNRYDSKTLHLLEAHFGVKVARRE